MFSFVAYAIYLNRHGSTFNILALSMSFILLAINPLLLFQVGFQLSYAAVFSIIWIYPNCKNAWYPKQYIIRKAWQIFSHRVGSPGRCATHKFILFSSVPFFVFRFQYGYSATSRSDPRNGFSNCHPGTFEHSSYIFVSPLQLLNWSNEPLGGMDCETRKFPIQDIYFDPMHLVLTCLLLITAVILLDRFKPSRVIVFVVCLCVFNCGI